MKLLSINVFIGFAITCLSTSSSMALDIKSLQWHLTSSQDNITVFAANVPGSKYQALLSTTHINANIDNIAAIIRNPQTCSQWVYRCKQSVNHQTINENEEYIYTSTNMPFPAKDRDIVAHIRWEYSENNQTITAIGNATNHVMDENRDLIRIKQATVIWQLSSINENQTEVRNIAHVNPEGNIPSWLSNQLSIEAPLVTLKQLKALAQNTSAISTSIIANIDYQGQN